jgi:hypothetical protein
MHPYLEARVSGNILAKPNTHSYYTTLEYICKGGNSGNSEVIYRKDEERGRISVPPPADSSIVVAPPPDKGMRAGAKHVPAMKRQGVGHIKSPVCHCVSKGRPFAGALLCNSPATPQLGRMAD